MYHIKRNRITLNIAITGFILFCFILSATLWNIFISESGLKYFGYIIFLIILIISSGIYIFFSTFKFNEQNKFDEYIENVRKEERIKALEEIKKTEDKDIEETEKIDIKNMANSVLPDMRGIKNINTFSEKLLSNISSHFEILHGICYVAEKKSFVVSAKYALNDDIKIPEFKSGETLPGQAAKNKELMIISDIPEDYFNAESGLGKSKPKNLIFLPVLHENETIALLELSTFKYPGNTHLELINMLKNSELGERFIKFKKNKEEV